MKPWIEKGVLIWCDENAGGVKTLKKKTEGGCENIKKPFPVTVDETATKELLDEFGAILSGKKQDISNLPLKNLIEHREILEHKNEVPRDEILTI